MTPADVEVAVRFQASVLRFVATGRPDVAEVWPRLESGSEPLAIFGQSFHIAPSTRASASASGRS